MTGSTYVFQAVPILLECEERLRRTLEIIPSARRQQQRCSVLTDLQTSLSHTDRLLRYHLLVLLEQETDVTTTRDYVTASTADILAALQDDNAAVDIMRRRRHGHVVGGGHYNPQEAVHDQHYFDYTRRSALDTLLFRLTVAIQITLVRINDVHRTFASRRLEKESDHTQTSRLITIGSIGLGMGLTTGILFMSQKKNIFSSFQGGVVTNKNNSTLAKAAVGGSLVLVVTSLQGWLVDAFLLHKISRSSHYIRSWNDQWIHCHSLSPSRLDNPLASRVLGRQDPLESDVRRQVMLGLDEKSRLLIEYTMQHIRKSSFWMSQGEMRWMMLKRFMDVYYASVGAAISTKQTSPLAILLMTGTASFFYTITGVSKKTMNVVNESSYDLIKNAWGMVSLPALKQASRLFTRYLKGASVADRIVVCGVPCFVLSKDPAPELASALRRPQHRSPSSLQAAQLPPIAEAHSHAEEESNFGLKSFGKRDVILHLTGGGFFAHTIASDLPYLLDWSAKTKAIVICPEYAILPETFPVALNQIYEIYTALVDGSAEPVLPFEVASICVTGESAGGNLAAALCVKLSQEGDAYPTKSVDQISHPIPTRMPDCCMLSCPVLDLSNEMSQSRVLGAEDPVLPHGLLTAISDAYLPRERGVDKKAPLASPLYASDEILSRFPPTLLFASSDDPLLDDAVTFNERLCFVGVESELRAATNVPHAYLGLATAAFPEAVEIQMYAMEWLNSKFKADRSR